MDSPIKEKRLKKKMTQKELSTLTGISRSNISEIERGLSNTTVTSLYEISMALELSNKDRLRCFDFVGNSKLRREG